MKVHRVLNANKLPKAHSEPLPGQVIPEPEPMEIDGEHQWEVEKILDCRNIRGKLKYPADWVGFDKEDKKWWPASNFCNAPEALREFHSQYPGKPGPPNNLTY
jgi:hypothetical protein